MCLWKNKAAFTMPAARALKIQYKYARIVESFEKEMDPSLKNVYF